MEHKMTFYPRPPEYVREGYSNFLLLKFFPQEIHRDYFLSGKLYMRQQTEFVNEELGQGRSDITEGAEMVVIPHDSNTFPDIRFLEKDGKAYVQIVEHTEKPEDYRDHQLFISYPARNQRRNLFCMYTLWFNNDNHEICVPDAEHMNNFGEYGVLITNHIEFFNRIAKAVNEDGSIQKMDCGFVNYVKSRNVMEMNPFIKPEEGFSYQNEFRFCAETDNTNLLELDTHIGFRDIAIPIRLNEFCESVKFVDGKIVFKADISNNSVG